MSTLSLTHLVLNAQLVSGDPNTVVFTDDDTKVTVTIPASAFVYQRSIDMEDESEHLMHVHIIIAIDTGIYNTFYMTFNLL